MPDGMSLKARLSWRVLQSLLFLFIALFFPAGTLKFWRDWAFMVFSACSTGKNPSPGAARLFRIL